MVSAIDYARRSLVALLKALAKTYGVVLELSRDSSDDQIKTAVRKVSRKAPSRQVLIMIPVTEKLFGKEGEHVHDPVCFFQFAPP